MSNQVFSKFLATMSMEHAVGTLTNDLLLSKTKFRFNSLVRVKMYDKISYSNLKSIRVSKYKSFA